jgi:hypothetical protein
VDPVRNPYVPNAGASPAALPGRTPLIEAFQTALGRTKARKAPRSLIPYGLRGVGKTVLLNRFADDARANGFTIASLEADDRGAFLKKLVGELRRILFAFDAGTKVNEAVKRAIRVLKSFVLQAGFGDLSVEIGVDPERGLGDTGDLAVDLTALLVAAGEAALAQDAAVLVAIDEVQYVDEKDFEALIAALHRVTQLALPVLAVATGLPQVLALAGEAKTYAERLFEYRRIGALSESDARVAIVDPAESEGVAFEPEALARLYQLTEGYPFFIQEWAYNAWNAAQTSPIGRDVVDRIEPGVLARLDESFFRVRYDRTSPKERRYMRAMAELGAGPYFSGDVAKQLDQPVTKAAPVRDALIRKGMIYSPSYGCLAFTAPLFDAFMRRIQPG